MSTETEIRTDEPMGTVSMETDIGEILDFELTDEVDIGESSDTVVDDTTVVDETSPEETLDIETPSEEPSPGEVTIEPTEPQDELATLKTQNENLVKLIANLTKGREASTAPSTLEVAETPPLDDVLNGINFDDVMESKESFVQLLKSVVASTKADTLREVSAHLPNLVTTQVSHNMSLKEMHDNFYSTHQELVPVKGYVAQVAKEIADANPDMSVVDVMEGAAKMVKESLGIQAVAPIVETPPKGAKPALPGGTHGAKQKSSKSGGLEAEIADLLD